MLPETIELRRSCGPVNLRSVNDRPSYFVGRAVVYGQWSELMYGTFREQIAAGAFDASLANPARDVYASIDHDRNRLLGRQSAQTLTLTPAESGIDAEVPIADYSYARDLVVAIQRGDIRGMSFIFDVISDKWETRGGVPHRTVVEADLYEVSWVSYPAYPQTDAGARAVPVPVPVAFPVAGEERALASARSLRSGVRRRRQRLAEADL